MRAEERTADSVSAAPASPSPLDAVRRDFEALYRDNVGSVMAYFSRRCADAQSVADLTAETFTEAIRSHRSFDPRRGSARGWIFGIAHHVYASYVQDTVAQGDAKRRLAGQRQLEGDEIAELEERIDAERQARDLLARLGDLTETDRSAVELVDVMQLPARPLHLRRVHRRSVGHHEGRGRIPRQLTHDASEGQGGNVSTRADRLSAPRPQDCGCTDASVGVDH